MLVSYIIWQYEINHACAYNLATDVHINYACAYTCNLAITWQESVGNKIEKKNPVTCIIMYNACCTCTVLQTRCNG